MNAYSDAAQPRDAMASLQLTHSVGIGHVKSDVHCTAGCQGCDFDQVVVCK